jgi:hypothetical protein
MDRLPPGIDESTPLLDNCDEFFDVSREWSGSESGTRSGTGSGSFGRRRRAAAVIHVPEGLELGGFPP